MWLVTLDASALRSDLDMKESVYDTLGLLELVPLAFQDDVIRDSSLLKNPRMLLILWF